MSNYLKKCFNMKDTNKPSIKSQMINNNLEIELYGNIGQGGITCEDIMNEVSGNIDNCNEIMLHLNSNGGEVLEGFGIYDFFHKYKEKLNVIVDKAACSIASVIALSGKSLKMAPNSYFMIHAPYSKVEGDTRELKRHGTYLETIENRLAKFYSEVLKKPYDEIHKKIVDESWFDEYQALDYGISNGIYKGKVNSLPLNLFEYSNLEKDVLYNLLDRKSTTKKIKEFTIMNDKAKAELLKIKNELEETKKEAEELLKEDEVVAEVTEEEVVEASTDEPIEEVVAETEVLTETPMEEMVEPAIPAVEKELLTEIIELLADADGNLSTEDILEVIEITDPMAAIKLAGAKGKARIMNMANKELKNRSDFKAINVVKNQSTKTTPLEGAVSDRRIDFSKLAQLK